MRRLIVRAEQFAEWFHRVVPGAYREITTEDVKRAWNSARDLKPICLLRKLTDHHRLLYELVSKNPGILSGDLEAVDDLLGWQEHVRAVAQGG